MLAVSAHPTEMIVSKNDEFKNEELCTFKKRGNVSLTMMDFADCIGGDGAGQHRQDLEGLGGKRSGSGGGSRACGAMMPIVCPLFSLRGPKQTQATIETQPMVRLPRHSCPPPAAQTHAGAVGSSSLSSCASAITSAMIVIPPVVRSTYC